MTGFRGVPGDAVAFYAELEQNNDRAWWLAHKQRYERSVRDPMVALGSALSDEFGTMKVFRPNRDVRFAHDKSPYKTHQGVVIPVAPTIGYYVQVSADGLMVAGGWWQGDPRTVAAYRAGVDSASGAELERYVEDLAAAGFTVDGDRMATRPKGVPADHARLDLMRLRTLTGSVHDEPPIGLDDPAYVDVVRERWRALRPMITWLAAALVA